MASLKEVLDSEETEIGSSFVKHGADTTSTVVTAGNNTNGVLLKTINMIADSTATSVTADGNPILQVDASNSTTSMHLFETKVKIPAGQAVKIENDSTNAKTQMTYEVL